MLLIVELWPVVSILPGSCWADVIPSPLPLDLARDSSDEYCGVHCDLSRMTIAARLEPGVGFHGLICYGLPFTTPETSLPSGPDLYCIEISAACGKLVNR